MKRISASLTLLLASSAMAFQFNYPHPTRSYVSAGAGAAFYDVSDNNHLKTGAGWPDDRYHVENVSSELQTLIAAGYIWDRPQTWFPNYSLGLRFQYISSNKISGTIDQYSLPAFKNYSYSYQAQLLSLLAIFKTAITECSEFSPYVTAGLGVTNYSTSDYQEKALPNVTPRVNPGFTGNFGNNFTWLLGLGVDYKIWGNLSASLEYNYTNFGTIYTGKGLNYTNLTGTNYDNEFLKNTLTASSLFFGLTYYLG